MNRILNTPTRTYDSFKKQNIETIKQLPTISTITNPQYKSYEATNFSSVKRNLIFSSPFIPVKSNAPRFMNIRPLRTREEQIVKKKFAEESNKNTPLLPLIRSTMLKKILPSFKKKFSQYKTKSEIDRYSPITDGDPHDEVITFNTNQFRGTFQNSNNVEYPPESLYTGICSEMPMSFDLNFSMDWEGNSRYQNDFKNNGIVGMRFLGPNSEQISKKLTFPIPNLSRYSEKNNESQGLSLTPKSKNRKREKIIGKKRKRKKAQKWTVEESERLKIAVKKFNGRKWKKIAEFVGSKDFKQCNQHWHRVMNPSINRKRWNKKEDRKLIGMVKESSSSGVSGNWTTFAKVLGNGRTDTQCRHRYFALKRGGSLVEEGCESEYEYSDNESDQEEPASKKRKMK